jgi:hypothetical protein
VTEHGRTRYGVRYQYKSRSPPWKIRDDPMSEKADKVIWHSDGWPIPLCAGSQQYEFAAVLELILCYHRRGLVKRTWCNCRLQPVALITRHRDSDYRPTYTRKRLPNRLGRRGQDHIRIIKDVGFFRRPAYYRLWCWQNEIFLPVAIAGSRSRVTGRSRQNYDSLVFVPIKI